MSGSSGILPQLAWPRPVSQGLSEGRTMGKVPNLPRLRVRATDSCATAALTRTPKPRSHLRWARHCRTEADSPLRPLCDAKFGRTALSRSYDDLRSEEHTSELQSPCN